jgi:flagellar motor switch protein FliN/FliY
MTINQPAESNRSAFASAFLDSLIAAISEASGSPWTLAAASDSGSAGEESAPVWILLNLEGKLQGEMHLEFRATEAAMLAAKCLRQPTGDYGEEESQAILELVQSAAGAFGSAVQEKYGAFTITTSPISDPPSDRSNVSRMDATDDVGNRASLQIYLDLPLTEALSLLEDAAQQAPAPAESAPRLNQQAQSEEAVADPLNLNLVMDVELNVTLRFGQRQLTLREVMELTSGSVIELDRQVDEPVELLLDGKVIARGEAVVIDGNYGLRVTDVPQPISSAVLR